MAVQEMDTSNGVLLPFYDPDTNMVYLCGKVWAQDFIKKSDLLSFPFLFCFTHSKYLLALRGTARSGILKWQTNPLMCTSSACTAAKSLREELGFLVREVWMSTSVKLPGKLHVCLTVTKASCSFYVLWYTVKDTLLSHNTTFLLLSRFYKLHERKVEPISMTVPRKVSHTQPLKIARADE